VTEEKIKGGGKTEIMGGFRVRELVDAGRIYQGNIRMGHEKNGHTGKITEDKKGRAEHQGGGGA